jgi:predicted membrane-bound dolichyl-phosphate-mannose-protein mannosyltransferase
MLTVYGWILGIAQITVVLLSVIAGFLALSMFKRAGQKNYLKSWRPLIIALVFFAAVEIAGLLRNFQFHSNPWITHVLVSFILVFLIAGLYRQINITKGCD